MNAIGRRRWRVAVVGCGGAAFGIHLPALAAHPGWQIVAVADRQVERAEQAAARFGISRVARDTADLLEGIDLLAVLTGVHEPWIEQALDARVHVFTEKPLSLDVDRSRRLRRRAARAGRLLEVGTIRAFDPAVASLLAQLPPAGLRGGWLVKADGCDETVRRPFLPDGAVPYTFAADPPQQAPACLSPAGRRALEIWLWQGYHLLTVIAMAAPHAQPLSCTLAADGDAVHGCVRTETGAVIACSVGPAVPGIQLDQAVLTGPDTTFTASFPPPYGPAGPGTLTTFGHQDDDICVAPDLPAVRMWSAIAQRLTDHALGQAGDGGTGRLAENVERLAAGLAYLTTTTTTSSGGAVPPMPSEVL